LFTMKNRYSIITILFQLFLFTANIGCAQTNTLKLVFIRHGERPDDGDNLNCQGLNRSMLLPAVLMKKFGKPANIYVPALNLGKKTKRTRMLQTITPFVAKYNLSINSAYDEEDYKHVSKALLQENGTVFIVWEHNNLAPLLTYLGVKNAPDWGGKDFDSIWIVTFPKGSAVLTRDKEGLNPPAGCPF
jgi:hypothetical protein